MNNIQEVEKRVIEWVERTKYISEEELEFIPLDVSGLNLTYMPPMPSNLKYLKVSNNAIPSIEELPPNLIHLDCEYNKINQIGFLPSTLKKLNCSNNNLTVLPELSQDLVELDCSYNRLSNLPKLPSTLLELTCCFNNLLILPSLPKNLLILDCSYNKLETLPSLPDKLSVLNCSNNNLIILPSLPKKILNLNASQNPLTTIPKKPSDIVKFTIQAVKASSTDKRNFSKWKKADEKLKNCFDDINNDTMDVFGFLNNDETRNNIILNINGLLKCYKRTILTFHVNQYNDAFGYVNIATVNGITYVRLFTNEYVTKESYDLLMNKNYSIYNLEPNSEGILINGKNEVIYNVNAYTVYDYLDINS